MKKDLQDMQPLLEGLKTSYENLELSKFDNAIYSEIIKEGTRKIEQRFKKTIESQIKKAGITSKIIQANMLKGNHEILQEFKLSLDNLEKFKPIRSSIDHSPVLPLGLITYEDHFFIISEDDEEKILENYDRIYLETEDEFKVYEDLHNLIQAHKRVTETFTELKYTATNKNVVDLPRSFFNCKDGEYSVNPKIIKTVVNHHSWKSEMKAQKAEWNNRRK
ncbi:hypothetical protein [Christiangramia sp.]|uniref:hypothetical protein n=1 Tax=Christiangramia sp. TaxID=1931228 RepID=UPI0026051B67|nr:hypothetical protein [Christiangramia sp.]